MYFEYQLFLNHLLFQCYGREQWIEFHCTKRGTGFQANSCLLISGTHQSEEYDNRNQNQNRERIRHYKGWTLLLFSKQMLDFGFGRVRRDRFFRWIYMSGWELETNVSDLPLNRIRYDCVTDNDSYFIQTTQVRQIFGSGQQIQVHFVGERRIRFCHEYYFLFGLSVGHLHKSLMSCHQIAGYFVAQLVFNDKSLLRVSL